MQIIPASQGNYLFQVANLSNMPQISPLTDNMRISKYSVLAAFD